MEEEYQKIMCDKDSRLHEDTRDSTQNFWKLFVLCFQFDRMKGKKNASVQSSKQWNYSSLLKQKVDPINFFHPVTTYSTVVGT